MINVNLNEEFCDLLEYISDIALAIRLNSAYNSEYRSLSLNLDNPDAYNQVSNILNNVMNYSDLIHDLDSLSFALRSNNVLEILRACNYQIERHNKFKADVLNHSIDHESQKMFCIDRGIEIFESIINKVNQTRGSISNEQSH